MPKVNVNVINRSCIVGSIGGVRRTRGVDNLEKKAQVRSEREKTLEKTKKMRDNFKRNLRLCAPRTSLNQKAWS